MIELAATLLRRAACVAVVPRLELIRARVMTAIVTAIVLVLFSLLGLACLFMLAFTSLSHRYDSETAALILFCFCVLMCLGALLAHLIARRMEDRVYQDRMSETLRGRLSASRSRELPEPSKRYANEASGRYFAEQSKQYFSEHMLGALIASTVAGLVFGIKPEAIWHVARRAIRGRR